MGREGMKDIFADLYNKVLSFFTSQTAEEEQTKGVAISRLKTILSQDRVGFSERALQMMKDEMVSCISKYMEIDEESFELQIDAVEDKTVLNLSIPVIRPKTDEEIDEAIKKQAEKTQVKAEEIVLELEEIIEERAQALAEEISKEISEEIVEGIAEEIAEVKAEITASAENEETGEEEPQTTDSCEQIENEEEPAESTEAEQTKKSKKETE